MKDKKEKFSKRFCLGCKRIVGQDIVLGGKPMEPVMCDRCAEETREMMQVYEVSCGWKPYFTVPWEDRHDEKKKT